MILIVRLNDFIVKFKIFETFNCFQKRKITSISHILKYLQNGINKRIKGIEELNRK